MRPLDDDGRARRSRPRPTDDDTSRARLMQTRRHVRTLWAHDSWPYVRCRFTRSAESGAEDPAAGGPARLVAARQDGPVQTIDSLNPADLSDVVAAVPRPTAADVVAAAGGRATAQRGVGRRPGAGPRSVIAQVGRLVEANKPRRWPRSSPARSASRTPRRSARSRRSSTPATSSSARAAGSTARPCRARCRTSSCSRSATRSASRSIITAGNFPVAVPSWYLVPALLCGNAVVWKPAEYARRRSAHALTALFLRGGRARRRAATVVADGPTTYDGLEAALTRGWCTRSASPARPRSASGSASCAGRHLQSPCLELGGKNPMVVMPDADLDLRWRARCSAASAPPGSGAPRSARSGARVRARRVRRPLRAAVSRPP